MTFIWKNVLFLLPISTVPFAASLLGSFPLSHTAQVAYALVLACCGGLLFACIHYALMQPDMFEPSPSREFKRNVATKTLLPVTMYLLAVPSSFVSPWMGLALLLAGPVITFAPIDSRAWHFLVVPTDWAYNMLTARAKG